MFIPCYLIYYIPSLVGLYYSKKKNDKKVNVKNLVVVSTSISIILELSFGIFVLCINSKYLIENSLLTLLIAESGVLMLIFSMSIHPKINQNINSIIGIRTRFSLESKENWYKMNRFGSFSFLLSSVAMIIIAVFIDTSLFYLSFIPLLLSTISIFIYESIIKKKKY